MRKGQNAKWRWAQSLLTGLRWLDGTQPLSCRVCIRTDEVLFVKMTRKRVVTRSLRPLLINDDQQRDENFYLIKLATRKWKGKRRVNEKGFGCCRNFKFLLAGCSTTGSSAKETDPEVQEISVSLPAELTTLDTTQTTDKVTFTVIQHLLKGRIVLMKRVSQFPVWRRKQSSVKMARHIPLN